MEFCCYCISKILKLNTYSVYEITHNYMWTIYVILYAFMIILLEKWYRCYFLLMISTDIYYI